jgi:circadian clock protein KaiB
MEMKRVKKSIEKLAKIVENLDQAKYILRLYVTGMTPKSTLAIDNVQKL